MKCILTFAIFTPDVRDRLEIMRVFSKFKIFGVSLRRNMKQLINN